VRGPQNTVRQSGTPCVFVYFSIQGVFYEGHLGRTRRFAGHIRGPRLQVQILNAILRGWKTAPGCSLEELSSKHAQYSESKDSPSIVKPALSSENWVRCITCSIALLSLHMHGSMGCRGPLFDRPTFGSRSIRLVWLGPRPILCVPAVRMLVRTSEAMTHGAMCWDRPIARFSWHTLSCIWLEHVDS
jgi:hypothetical protein